MARLFRRFATTRRGPSKPGDFVPGSWLNRARPGSRPTEEGGLALSQVFLVTRHGDRSPGKNMFAGYTEESAEEEAWSLVAADRQRDKELKHLEVAFPVHNFNPETLDFRTAPFGALTGKGFDQLSQVGQMYSDLYADFIDPSYRVSSSR